MITIEYVKTSKSSNIRKTVNENFQTLRESQRFFKADTKNAYVSNIILIIENNKYNFSNPVLFVIMRDRQEIEKHLEYYGNRKGLFKIQ
jgi:hypothetical protein